MNKLPLHKRCKIIQLLVEGNSLRSCSRIADVSYNAVLKLLVEMGQACLKFHSQTVVAVRSQRVECDEIWSFVYSKDKNIKEERFGVGSVWTWIGMDSDTKLVISWFVGERNMQAAKFFMNDLWCRLRTRVQLNTDGLSKYNEAVADTFGGKVDFAQVVKQYDERDRYIGARKTAISGRPDMTKVSTNYIERLNLTIRMSNKRFVRRTNAFSKKYDNHCYMLAIQFVYYNFVRLHKTLRATPAMRSGLTKRFMKLEDMAELTALNETGPRKRGPYKKREISK